MNWLPSLMGRISLMSSRKGIGIWLAIGEFLLKVTTIYSWTHFWTPFSPPNIYQPLGTSDLDAYLIYLFSIFFFICLFRRKPWSNQISLLNPVLFHSSSEFWLLWTTFCTHKPKNFHTWLTNIFKSRISQQKRKYYAFC